MKNIGVIFAGGVGSRMKSKTKPKQFLEIYGKPIIITENGMACHDTVSVDGKVHDENRIDYLRRYLREYKRAADDGIELNGYYVWSLTDNFEWGHGYNQRFGLTYMSQRSVTASESLWFSK